MADRNSTPSNLTFEFFEQKRTRKDGKVMVHEVEVRDGPKGISFKFFSKADGKTVKYLGKQNADGTFFYMTDINGKKDKQEKLSKADVLKLIKTVKGLEEAAKYLSGAKMSRTTGGKKRSSRKSNSKKRKSRGGSMSGGKKKSSGKRKSRKKSKSRK